MNINFKSSHHKLVSSLLILFLSLAGIGIIFYITYEWDNKYTYPKDSSICVLSDEWEFYPDCSILSDTDNRVSLPDAPYLISIGQVGTFSSYNRTGSPFGTAVYRKNLFLGPSDKGWLMELPEIFSASKIYINGKLIHSYGALSENHYKIHIQNSLIPLPAGNTEIIIQASNYSHYYSGLTYPPLIGETDTITKLVICRLIFYALLCFFTLGCSVVSFTVWFHRQTDSLYIAYGLLCLGFAIHISYPLIHWMGINAGVLPYVIEDTAYFAVLSCMAILTYRLAGNVWHRSIHIACYSFSIGSTLFPLLAFYILFPLYPRFVLIYSSIMSFPKIIMSIYLIVAAFLGTLNNSQKAWLLSGNAVFGFGILFDYLSAGRFEPVRFGWQTEYCGFIMVLLFTALILSYNKKALAQRQYLTEHLQEEVERKTDYLTSMIEERKHFLSSVAHDLKAPVAAINTYIDYIRSSGIGTDEELFHYLDMIDRKSSQIREDVQNLQLFHINDSLREEPAILDLNDLLNFVYSDTFPDTYAEGIHFHLELPEHTCCIYGKRETLIRAFENLIINAIEHTPMEGSITLHAAYTDNYADIILSDNGEGIAPEDISQIFNYEFSTKKKGGICGLGLYYAKISFEEYGGSIKAESKPGEYTNFHVHFPLHISAEKL